MNTETLRRIDTMNPPPAPAPRRRHLLALTIAAAAATADEPRQVAVQPVCPGQPLPDGWGRA